MEYIKNILFTKKTLRIIFLVLLIIVSFSFLIAVKKSLLPFFIGILFSYLFNPVISYFQKRGYPREKAVILLSIIVFNIVFIGALFLLPLLVKEMKSFVKILPDYIIFIRKWLERWNIYFKINYSAGYMKGMLDQFLQQIENYISLQLNNITEMIMSSITLIASFLGAPVITYYVLRDIDHLKKLGLGIIPSGKKGSILKFFRRVNDIFSGYLRGQAWLSLIITVLISIGLFVLKIKFFLLLGIIAGITNVVPYIGPTIGAIPAIFVASFSSPLQVIGIIVLYILIQQIESSFIQPRVMSESVGLHPLTVIFSLLAGTNILGIWGLIFAIPLAGIIKAFLILIFEFVFPLNQKAS